VVVVLALPRHGDGRSLECGGVETKREEPPSNAVGSCPEVVDVVLTGVQEDGPAKDVSQCYDVDRGEVLVGLLCLVKSLPPVSLPYPLGVPAGLGLPVRYSAVGLGLTVPLTVTIQLFGDAMPEQWREDLYAPYRTGGGVEETAAVPRGIEGQDDVFLFLEHLLSEVGEVPASELVNVIRYLCRRRERETSGERRVYTPPHLNHRRPRLHPVSKHKHSQRGRTSTM
jgi:hypothetical protein